MKKNNKGQFYLDSIKLYNRNGQSLTRNNDKNHQKIWN